MQVKGAAILASVFLLLSILLHFDAHLAQAAGTGSLEILDLNVFTSRGDTVLQASLNEPVLLATTVKNSDAEVFDFVAIFDIRDDNNVTIDILMFEGKINIEQTKKIELQWDPLSTGRFTIRTFYVSNNDSPNILSRVAEKSLTVDRSDTILVPRTIPAGDQDEATLEPSTDNEEIPDMNADTIAPYTVMMYMVASDLESRNYAATSDIREMLEAEIDPLVNVVIETGGSSNSTIDDTRFIDFTKVQRFEITDHEAKLIMDLGARNMGDSDTLKSFVGWAATSYPAERYILIMWDHGNGIRGFGYDDIYGDSLSILEIKEGLKEANRYFEVIGFDGCLMATLEVASQLSFRANYLVASQEVEPEWGWDYETILSSFNSVQGESIDGRQLGTIVADSYMEHSREKANLEGFDLDRYVTLSVVDLSKVAALSSDIKDLGDDLGRYVTDLDDARTFAKLVRYTERYGSDYDGTSGYSDLYEIADNTGKLFPSLDSMTDLVKVSLDEAVVYNVRGEARPNAHGLSIFMQLDAYESGQEYLTYLVPEWLGVIESGARTLASDKKAPSGWLDYSSGKIEGEIEDDDVDYGSISIYREVEDSSKYQVISYSQLDSSDFLTAEGEVEYELNDLISLCNEDECVPVFVLLEDYEDSLFAYFPVRLVSEDESYDEYVTLIYQIENNNFIFIGAWEGFQEETAQRGLRALTDGDRIFTLMYELDDEDQDYFEEIENEPIEVTNGFGPEYESLAGEYTFQMSVCDYSANCVHSEVFDLA